MSVRVVDASALGALIFGEPKAEKISEALSDEPMAAPALLWFELASVCLKKIRTHPTQKTLILEAFELATKLNIDIIEVDHAPVIELARDVGLTTYDASYVWLAKELQGELITLDTKMQRAIKSEKVRRSYLRHVGIALRVDHRVHKTCPQERKGSSRSILAKRIRTAPSGYESILALDRIL